MKRILVLMLNLHICIQITIQLWNSKKVSHWQYLAIGWMKDIQYILRRIFQIILSSRLLYGTYKATLKSLSKPNNSYLDTNPSVSWKHLEKYLCLVLSLSVSCVHTWFILKKSLASAIYLLYSVYKNLLCP